MKSNSLSSEHPPPCKQGNPPHEFFPLLLTVNYFQPTFIFLFRYFFEVLDDTPPGGGDGGDPPGQPPGPPQQLMGHLPLQLLLHPPPRYVALFSPIPPPFYFQSPIFLVSTEGEGAKLCRLHSPSLISPHISTQSHFLCFLEFPRIFLCFPLFLPFSRISAYFPPIAAASLIPYMIGSIFFFKPRVWTPNQLFHTIAWLSHDFHRFAYFVPPPKYSFRSISPEFDRVFFYVGFSKAGGFGFGKLYALLETIFFCMKPSTKPKKII